MTKRLKFPAKSVFFTTVRQRVDQYFRETGKKKHADARMWFKVAVFLTGFVGCYMLIISGYPSKGVLLLLAFLLGMCSAFVGFNICHDALHGALSPRKGVNALFGMVFNLLGASPYIWKISHNGVHHTFTNIPGHDDDLVVAPGLIRIEENDPVTKIQRYQHWYAFPLYGLASLSWLFRKDFMKIFRTKIGQVAVKHPLKEYVNLFASKFLYCFLFIMLPLLVLNINWWQFVIGFLAMHLAQGLTMGLVFQLAHVVEDTDFPVADSNGTMEEAWAEHQMRTTANFSMYSPVASFLLGGLNRQIEHHLFPGVCHVHYAKLGAIVKQTAKEYGLPYIENRTFLSAMRSHYRLLKKFSVQKSCPKILKQSA